MKRSRWLVVCGQAVASAALIGLLLHNFEADVFLTLFGRIPAGFYVGCLVALALAQTLYAAKWLVIMKALGLRVRYLTVLAQYFVGLFFNNLLPSMVGGDVSKVYYVGRSVGYVAVGISVLVDRASSLLVLSVLAACAIWLVDVDSLGLTSLLQILGAAWIVAIPVTILALFGARRSARARQLGARIAQRAPASLLVALRAVHPRASAVVLPTAAFTVIGYYTLLALIYQLLFRLLGYEVRSLPALVVVVCVIAVLANIPISLNGIGLREQLHVLMFGLLGVPKEAAVAASLLVFSLMLVISSVGGVLWVLQGAANLLARQQAGRTRASRWI